MTDNLIYNFQLFCISATVAIAVYYFNAAICGRKNGIKSILIMILYWLYRFFFHELYYSVYLGRIYGEKDWFINVYIFLQLAEIIIFLLVMAYAFQGSLVKILLFSFITECIATVILVITQNLLVGSINMGMNQGNPGKTILKILAGVLLAAIILLSIYRLLYPNMVRLQPYRVKHTKIIWLLIMMEYLSSIILNTSQEVISRMNFNQFLEIYVINILLYLILFAIISFMIYKQRKRKKDLLEKQMQSIQVWTDSIEQEEDIIFSQKNDIHDTLLQLGQIQSDGEKNEQVSLYIHHLKENYAKIQAGIYSSNRKLDAFLVTLQNQCKKQGMKVDIHFQGYQGVHLSERELEELVWTIFQNMSQVMNLNEESQMILRAANQGEYSLIWLKMMGQLHSENVWKSQMKKCQKQAKIYLKPHHGFMTAEKKEGELQVKVMVGR